MSLVIIFSVGLFLIFMIFSFWMVLPLPKSVNYFLPSISSGSHFSSNLKFKW